MRQTFRPASASAAPRFTVVVVLPTPPFWFIMAMTRVRRGGFGSGDGGILVFTSVRTGAGLLGRNCRRWGSENNWGRGIFGRKTAIGLGARPITQIDGVFPIARHGAKARA